MHSTFATESSRNYFFIASGAHQRPRWFLRALRVDVFPFSACAERAPWNLCYYRTYGAVFCIIALPKRRKNYEPVQKSIRRITEKREHSQEARWPIENGPKHLKSLAENVRAKTFVRYYLRLSPSARARVYTIYMYMCGARTWFLLGNAIHARARGRK